MITTDWRFGLVVLLLGLTAAAGAVTPPPVPVCTGGSADITACYSRYTAHRMHDIQAIEAARASWPLEFVEIAPVLSVIVTFGLGLILGNSVYRL